MTRNFALLDLGFDRCSVSDGITGFFTISRAIFVAAACLKQFFTILSSNE